MTRLEGPEAPIEPVARLDGRPPARREPNAPEGGVTLADALYELVAILPGLRLALYRQARSDEPAIACRKRHAARLCGVSDLLIERLLAAGKFPKPGAHAGYRWMAEGGSRK
jgi:hypothetical protein